MDSRSEAVYGQLSEQEYRSLYHRAPCGYLTTAGDGLIISLNQTLTNWLALDPAQIIGQEYFRNLLTPASQIFAQTHCAPLLQMQGWISEVALELRRHGNEPLPVLMSAIQEPIAPNQPAVNRITLFNATDRRHYERALLQARGKAEELSAVLQQTVHQLEQAHATLAEQNTELSAIFSGLPAGFFRINRDGVIKYCNPFFTAMTGCATGVEAEAWLTGLQNPVSAELQQLIASCWKHDRTGTLRFRHSGDSGLVWREIRLWPIQPGISAMTGSFLGVLRDVTADVQAEEYSRLKAAHEAASDVAGGVAHNFNSLWSVIMASVEQAGTPIDSPPPGEQTQPTSWPSLSRMATERGAVITKKLMAYAGQLHLRPSVFPMQDFLGDMYEKLRQALLHQQTLIVHNQPGASLVNADRDELQAVLLELVKNAAQASKPQGVIQIGLEPAVQQINDARFYVLYVSDQGCGMSEATLRMAEIPFFTTKEVGGGIGLGLSFARGFVNQSNGFLEIRSTPGVASTIRIGLPSADSAAN